MSRINVAVLMGGRSEEREVSLSTGRMILRALDAEKYNAFAVDSARFGGAAPESGKPGSPKTGAGAAATDEPADLRPLESIIMGPDGSQPKPDVVFIALHGRFGEDGTVQGLLEMLGIPYVGSGVLASALAMDKVVARKVMEHEGIPVPKAIVARRPTSAEALAVRIEEGLGYPVVLKPNRQGSTIGLTIVRAKPDLSAAVELAFGYDDDVLVEEFINGTEITVSVLGNDELQALPVVEIVPASGVYDYYSKYTPGATDEIVPARVSEKVYSRAQELGLACHKALRCQGMSRADMMVRDEGVYVLEVNTIPGMTPTSLLPRAAQAAGIEFPQLLDLLIGFALEKG